MSKIDEIFKKKINEEISVINDKNKGRNRSSVDNKVHRPISILNSNPQLPSIK